MGEADYLASYG